MISFTCDVDWASEEVLTDTIQLFETYGVKCTFFSTHHSDVLSKCNKKLFEIGIHPDFNPFLRGNSSNSVEDIIDELMELHPEAVGVRSHALFQNTWIMDKFAAKKLVYEANVFLPYHQGLNPFRLWNGMVEIPFNWEDDVHWAYGYSFDSSRINLNADGLNVFNFHPIHIYLNVENKFRYNAANKIQKNTDEILKLRNTEVPGTRDLLIGLLKYCNDSRLKTCTLLETAEEFLGNN